jgi:site-specific DNA recombinase
LGVERQRKDCASLIEGAGLELIDTIVDNDVSASKGKPRVGYQRLCKMIADGSVDVVVCWHPDRLTRHPRELEDLVDLLESSSTRVMTVQGGDYDLSTSAGRMVARVVGAMARAEVERKSERQKAKAAELAAAGKVGGGGHRPFGFEDDRIAHREGEADATRWATEQIIEGRSLQWIADRMPVPAVSGKPWTRTSVRRILIAPRTAGLRQHRGEIAGPAVWPAIVERDRWEACRAIIADPSRKKWRPTQRYLLTGGLIVDYLGREMFARPSDGHRRMYRTLPDELGPGVGIDAEGVESYVLDALEHTFRIIPDPTELPAASPASQVGEDLGALEAELAELATLRGDGAISLAEWMAARTPLVERIEAARAAVSATQGRTVDLTHLRDFRSWEINEKRDLVAALLESVEIGPGRRGLNRFDPTRVTTHLRPRDEILRWFRKQMR